MLRIAVLASGRGTNLQALTDAIVAGSLDARIVGVFSDKANAGAVQIARSAGIHVETFDARAFESRNAFDEALFRRVEAREPELIVCAGYMRLISAAAVDACRGRLLNIHPSLLPAFKGLRTHAKAIAAGARQHGASVHYVTPDLDGGPVISQVVVPVLPGDDVDALGKRVLIREHALLFSTVALVAAGRLKLSGDVVTLDGATLATPLQLGANNQFP